MEPGRGAGPRKQHDGGSLPVGHGVAPSPAKRELQPGPAGGQIRPDLARGELRREPAGILRPGRQCLGMVRGYFQQFTGLPDPPRGLLADEGAGGPDEQQPHWQHPIHPPAGLRIPPRHRAAGSRGENSRADYTNDTHKCGQEMITGQADGNAIEYWSAGP